MRSSESIIGHSPALAACLDQVSRLAGIHRPVLLQGERGTGKELVAQRLHYLSPRWEAPLVKVNCATLSDNLLESELFGHEPGAFTGATRMRKGRFERAEGGTLFLDEIATMSLPLQEKLLRLVEYGEFERLGGQATLHIDVRVIGASNLDLRTHVRAGRFRADLLDRLSFDVVHLPPLRHRTEDIAELANHFALHMCAELGWELFAGFTEMALQQLERHAWPGNVRELKSAVERSLFRWDRPTTAVDKVIIDPFESPHASADAAAPPVPDTTADSRHTKDFQSLTRDFEIGLLRRALSENGRNQRRAAAALGLTYDQMRGMVRKYSLS
ncbi:MAG: phage shock protein operon transcriptional activator [Halioglobus sp.]|nr:phage shock protein operon transcriptional activator [Halioglobus sp.]